MCNAEAVLFEWKSVEENKLNTLLLFGNSSSYNKLTSCLLIVINTCGMAYSFGMSYNLNIISKNSCFISELVNNFNRCDSFYGTTHLLLWDPQTVQNSERDSVRSGSLQYICIWLAYEAHVIMLHFFYSTFPYPFLTEKYEITKTKNFHKRNKHEPFLK